MRDPADKQTASLTLEQPKRGRGRPETGEALTPAEKQKAYRERQKAKREELEREVHNAYATSRCDENYSEELFAELEAAKAEAAAAIARAKQAEADFVTLRKKLDKALATIQEMKKGNVTESKGRLSEGMQRIIQDVHDVTDALEGRTWRIQRKARANGKWVTLKGSYWNEARAEDALAEIPNKKGGWWRIIEVKSEVED